MVRGSAGNHTVRQRTDPGRDPEGYRGTRPRQAQTQAAGLVRNRAAGIFLWTDSPIDKEVADRRGRLLAAAERPLPAIDSLLAATALTHGLTLISRNVDDFPPDLQIINPWETERT